MGEQAPRLALDSGKYSVRTSITVWIVIAGGFWLALALLVGMVSG
jgi:hypothetical protein